MIFLHPADLRETKQRQRSMNVLFHTTAAIGVIAMLTDTRAKSRTIKHMTLSGLLVFLAGIASHGALDYIPHCYPIHSKLDAIAGLTLMITLTLISNQPYRPIVALAFLGSIFPDLVDLSFPIINTYLGVNLPVTPKLFPWHCEEYSGSIFVNDCRVSAVNHFILLAVVIILCYCRKADIKNIVTRTDEKSRR